MKRISIAAAAGSHLDRDYPLSIFGLSADNRMLWKTSYLQASGSYWSPAGQDWENLGGSFDSPPAAIRSYNGRVHIVGLGTDNSMWWRYWDGSAWSPWQHLGGVFTSAPVVTTRVPGDDAFHLFGLNTESQMLHKYWDHDKWYPSQTEWQFLGGRFASSPAAAGFGSTVHVVGLGTDNQMWHRVGFVWTPGAVGWPFQWEPLGGTFSSPPAAVGMGPSGMDFFGLGTNNAMYHKRFSPEIGWYPSPTLWEPLGGVFASPPAVAALPSAPGGDPKRFDLFGLHWNNGLLHKVWDGSAWHPAGEDWEALGGEHTLTSPPAVARRNNRLDVFCLGFRNEMLHKYWDGTWHPSPTGWEDLGGRFNPLIR